MSTGMQHRSAGKHNGCSHLRACISSLHLYRSSLLHAEHRQRLDADRSPHANLSESFCYMTRSYRGQPWITVQAAIQSAWTASTGYQTVCCRCHIFSAMHSCTTACCDSAGACIITASDDCATFNDIMAVSRAGRCCRMAAQTAGCAAKHASWLSMQLQRVACTL